MTSRTTTWLGRTFALLLAALGSTGCGDYSNEDFVFINAVPRAEDLRSKLTDDTEPTGLRAPPPIGGLLVDPANGDLSALTRGGSALFNGGIEALLGLLEAAIERPPSSREDGRRIWGPIVDRGDVNFEARLVMDRIDATHFVYSVEERRRTVSPRGEWVSFFDGAVESLEGVRRGKGAMAFRIGTARAAGKDMPALAGLEEISAAYDTAGFPYEVAMHAVGVGPTPADLLYTYREQEDHSGSLSFTTTFDGDPTAGVLTLLIASQWLPSGAGVGAATVTAGTVVGATWVQCWDEAFGIHYSNRSWAPPAEGNPLECTASLP